MLPGLGPRGSDPPTSSPGKESPHCVGALEVRGRLLQGVPGEARGRWAAQALYSGCCMTQTPSLHRHLRYTPATTASGVGPHGGFFDKLEPQSGECNFTLRRVGVKSYRAPSVIVLSVMILAALACGGSFSTANIARAWLSADESGTPETTRFSQDQPTFYCIVELANAPDDTTVRAVWTAVSAEGTEANFLLDETELTSGDGTLTFDLTNDQLWPVGSYSVDLYLNEKLDRTLTFEVR